MVRINEIDPTSVMPTPLEPGSENQIFPAGSVIESAAAELAEIQEGALSETMEEMSLVLGSRLREDTGVRVKKESDWHQRTLEMLVQQKEGVPEVKLTPLLDKFSYLSQDGDVQAALRGSGLPVGMQLLLLSGMLSKSGIDPRQRKRLKTALEQLMSEEGWELELFAVLEDVPMQGPLGSGLRRIYQQAKKQGEQGLAHWFSQLKQWPDRKKRIRCLLRTLSYQLSCQSESVDRVKLSVVIVDLRRLLLFLTLEDHCNALARATKLQGDDVLQCSLQLVEQSWVYPDWLAKSIQQLSLASAKRIGFLRRWRELISMMPDACFNDEDQREQIQEAMLNLLDQWAE